MGMNQYVDIYFYCNIRYVILSDAFNKDVIIIIIIIIIRMRMNIFVTKKYVDECEFVSACRMTT